MSQYPRGSEWRRWDLHLHTASSYDYKYNHDDCDNLLCEKIIENNISLVVITDHFIIDETRINNLKQLAPNITFLPGEELRTDKGDTNIHIILIFSNTIDLKNLCEDFNVFKRSKAKNPTDNERIYWDYNDITDFAKEHNGIISIHAGRKDKGVDDRITNAFPHNQAIKAEYASTVDIFEMGQERDFDEYKKKVFPSIGCKSMVICSDNHDPRTYNMSKKLWVKADPNFKGLKQAIIEPDRIFVGEIPPALNRIHNNKTKTIDAVDVNWIESYVGNRGEWFKDIKIPLNPEMTVIIGNKGSGKTAIAEIIGLLSNSKNENDFAFLENKKFRDKKLSKNFNATLTWYDNVHKISKNLDEHIDENSDELVHCVPQNSFEKFCNDNSEDGFIKEINSVVFSRMKKGDRLNFSTFEDLIHNERTSIASRKKDIGVGIDDLNEKIKLLEEKRDFDYKKSLENSKTTSERELSEHIKIKPLEVKPPEDLVTEDYSKDVSALKKIEGEIEKAQDALEIATKHLI
jgi:energy-coupling factor transporter ATP-binding protein EcfA2